MTKFCHTLFLTSIISMNAKTEIHICINIVIILRILTAFLTKLAKQVCNMVTIIFNSNIGNISIQIFHIKNKESLINNKNKIHVYTISTRI